jgi:hypothetical protein
VGSLAADPTAVGKGPSRSTVKTVEREGQNACKDKVQSLVLGEEGVIK